MDTMSEMVEWGVMKAGEEYEHCRGGGRVLSAIAGRLLLRHLRTIALFSFTAGSNY